MLDVSLAQWGIGRPHYMLVVEPQSLCRDGGRLSGAGALSLKQTPVKPPPDLAMVGCGSGERFYGPGGIRIIACRPHDGSDQHTP